MIQDLIQLLGPDVVSVQNADLETHSTDKWFASAKPEVVVFAQSTEQVSKLIRFAQERKIPVTARGAGVGYVGGCVPLHGGIALSLARMTQIKEINLEDGVAVVEPGVITGDLQAAVRKLGWFYPPDPASLKECSLGGNIATNAGGPRCLKYGVTRHYVLGLEVVLADGTICRVGGRCHKNKTGFDLVGTFVGSEGLLGIVTEATLRLLPHPQTRSMISAGFGSFPEVAATVHRILNSGFLPSALEIADKFTLRAAREYLGESVTPKGDAHLMVELDGHEASVKGELHKLADLICDAGAVQVELAEGEEACERFWKLRREFSYSLRNTGLIKLNEDIVVPRRQTGGSGGLRRAPAKRAWLSLWPAFGHAGDGNIHVNIMVPTMDDPAIRERAELALDELFHFIIDCGGAITGEHGIGIAKQRWLKAALHPGSLHLHHVLKQALDPAGLLNPGKVL